MYAVLAQITAAVHFLGLAYIVFGGFLGWRWPRALLPHLPFALWGLLVVLGINPQHPLTWLEDQFRMAQGLDPMPGGFNEYYIYGTLFPHELLPHVAVLVISLVILSYVGTLVLWYRRRQRERAPSEAHEG
ncbi:DUF2784 domain-containing protein [Haloechinothrix sp. LS1_15]|uniref:DUF2784 domain-containing protein n=1 Tax=Haloechinothrix sp. LS1_15 TaxID=2652248 RepID=UPI00294AEAFA|nr:DUF2784 domain-containing protein [Haloechinothrix sp. LS1_15]